jgi:DNA invertase Pin-like site-specific DNA recombinase
MKVCLYARVSLEEGNKEDRRYQEPENQLEPLREWAKRQGWEIIKEYVDRGSGADSNRPNFKQMLTDAMLMRFNSILVWKLDRFSREPMFVAVGRIDKLRQRGVGIKSLTESWLDTGKENPMADLTLSIMSWAGSEERRKISERTKAGIQRRRNIGQWKGGRPKKNITEEQIKEARELLDKGKSIVYIQRRLDVSRNTLKDRLKGGSLLVGDK